jgi:hypothetical protein
MTSRRTWTLVVGIALWFTATGAGAQSFRFETVRTGSLVGFNSAVAVSLNGRPRVTYYNGAGTAQRLKYDVYPWGGPAETYASSYPMLLGLALDPDGNPLFSYATNQVTPAVDVRSLSGLEFSDNCSSQPSLKIDNAGNAHLAFVRDNSLFCEGLVSLHYATNLTGTWQTSSALGRVRGTGTSSRKVALDLGAGGQPRIAFIKRYSPLEEEYDDLRYREFSGSWSDELVLREATPFIDDIDLAVDSSDEPHIVFNHRGAAELRYATRSNGTWAQGTIDRGDGIDYEYASIAVDSDDVPHVVYWVPETGTIRYARRSGSNWFQQTLEASSESPGQTSIAIDAYDGIHISYSVPAPGVAGSDRSIRYANYTDCNDNNVHDLDEIDAGLVEDCNENGHPDACDIALGFSADCDGNGIPDECQADCNTNGVADACDISSGTSLDCDGNGVPDECDPDCNGNDVPDACDIAAGNAVDCNLNLVPDSCENIHDLPTLANGGFEGDAPASIPSTYGVWGHDQAEIVGAENGITPVEGTQMLKFLATQPWGADAAGASSDMIQLVGLCRVSGVSGGNVIARATAMFNRVEGDAETDREFGLRLRAYDDAPANFPYDNDVFIAEEHITLVTDGDPQTWESLSGTLTVPAGATYVALWLEAREDVMNDALEPEFDGHYVDDVRIEICDTSLLEAPVVVDGSFETGSPTPGLPTSVGTWGFDLSEAVAAENGIVPPDGSRMLRFLATSATGATEGGACDVIQLTSLCLLPEVSTGGVTATVNALFNRVAGDGETDRLFGIRLRAFDGLPQDFDGHGELADHVEYLTSDPDPATWEMLSSSLTLPPDSRYLAVWVFASEDVVNDSTDPEFDGHYVDAVGLSFDGVVTSVPLDVPSFTILGAPSPNPFQQMTTIRYELRSSSPVALEVFDVAGRLVRELHRGVQSAGSHVAVWDATNRSGAPAAAGVYLVRLRADGTLTTRRVALVR